MASRRRKGGPQPEPRDAAERIRAKVDKAARGGDREYRDVRWWKSDEPHRAIFDAGQRIARTSHYQRTQDLYMACLYGDSSVASLVYGPGAISTFTPQTMSTNIVKRQTDAFTARLSKSRPVPMGLTTGGNYGQQRRAKNLSKFFEGVLDSVGYWETREQRIRDGALFGSGFAWNYRIGRKFVHDRFFPWELEVDPRAAMYGKPRDLSLRRYIDRLELIERFPEHEEAIWEADGKADEDRFPLGWDDTCDLVLCRATWHLPSIEDGDPGHFAFACSTTVLGEVREYTRPYAPFSKFDVLPPLVGYRGESFAAPLVGIQYEANAVGMRMQEQGYMVGSYWLVEDGSDVETDVLDNGAGTVIRYRGAPPQAVTPQPWHPAFFDWLMFLRGRAPAEETRLSEQAVRGEKPPGLDSGAAVRAWHQLDDEAHVPAGRSDERDVVNTCWQLFDLAEEMHAERGEGKDDRKPYVVRVEYREHGRSVLQELDYAKVRLDREQFTLRVFPTSFLTGTPAEQRQAVKELIDMGFLSQDEALILLDFPDLQRVLTLRGAARRNIERLLEKLRDADDPENVYEYPEPAWNLELVKALSLMGYLEAKLDGVPERNLKAILKLAIDAQAVMDGEAAQQPSPADEAGAEAQAMLDANAAPEDLMPAPEAGMQYAPPEQAPLPVNAVAPETMALVPGAPA